MKARYIRLNVTLTGVLGGILTVTGPDPSELRIRRVRPSAHLIQGDGPLTPPSFRINRGPRATHEEVGATRPQEFRCTYMGLSNGGCLSIHTRTVFCSHAEQLDALIGTPRLGKWAGLVLYENPSRHLDKEFEKRHYLKLLSCASFSR